MNLINIHFVPIVENKLYNDSHIKQKKNKWFYKIIFMFVLYIDSPVI